LEEGDLDLFGRKLDQLGMERGSHVGQSAVRKRDVFVWADDSGGIRPTRYELLDEKSAQPAGEYIKRAVRVTSQNSFNLNGATNLSVVLLGGEQDAKLTSSPFSTRIETVPHHGPVSRLIYSKGNSLTRKQDKGQGEDRKGRYLHTFSIPPRIGANEVISIGIKTRELLD
jgi:hypothetical protein